jgi:hypothetical protein
MENINKMLGLVGIQERLLNAVCSSSHITFASVGVAAVELDSPVEQQVARITAPAIKKTRHLYALLW